jgi:hypothetical protein
MTDAALETLHGIVLPDDLRARHQALRAEYGRLRGWQQWGGGRARDDLTAEAEELARLTLAAADPEAAAAPKLHLKAHADAIQGFVHAGRNRPFGARQQPLWQRFDTALQTAYQPVAAQQAAVAARGATCSHARLLATLAAISACRFRAGRRACAYWKEQLHALDFHVAWRQLGPLEHTVPAGAHCSTAPARRRRNASRRRCRKPGARPSAVREQFIARAEA